MHSCVKIPISFQCVKTKKKHDCVIGWADSVYFLLLRREYKRRTGKSFAHRSRTESQKNPRRDHFKGRPYSKILDMIWVSADIKHICGSTLLTSCADFSSPDYSFQRLFLTMTFHHHHDIWLTSFFWMLNNRKLLFLAHFSDICLYFSHPLGGALLVKIFTVEWDRGTCHVDRLTGILSFYESRIIFVRIKI